MKDLFKSFETSIENLKEVLQYNSTLINRDASIKRFELTFELSWKITQKVLLDQGLESRSPKTTFKEAFKFGLLSDEDAWLEMIHDRNLAIHTYNEELAVSLYERIPNYLNKFLELKDKLN